MEKTIETMLYYTKDDILIPKAMFYLLKGDYTLNPKP